MQLHLFFCFSINPLDMLLILALEIFCPNDEKLHMTPLLEQFALVVGGQYREAYLALPFCLIKFFNLYPEHTLGRDFSLYQYRQL